MQMKTSGAIGEASDRLVTELAKIEEEVVTGYTLADAIREGSSVSDQAFDWSDSSGAICALSAAAAAVQARQKLNS